MKAFKYIAWPLVLVALSCSSDVTNEDNGTDGSTTDAVTFFADMNTVSLRADATEEQEKYINIYFKEGDHIRLVNTGESATPKFAEPISDGEDNSTNKYYDYVLKDASTATPDTDVPYGSDTYKKFQFVNAASSPAIKWSKMNLAGSYYTLEGAFFPTINENGESDHENGTSDLEYFKNNTLPTEQSTAATLKRADMMLAHKLIHVSEWGKEIHLKFRHVFSLVYVSLTYPLYRSTDATGYAAPTASYQPAANLTDMYNQYLVNYNASISSDGIISVTANDNTETTDVKMCFTDYSTDTANQTVTVNYLAIIPKQNITSSGDKALLRFWLKKNASASAEEVFRYVPRGTTIEVDQGMMTRLDLVLTRDNVNPILVKATVGEWDNTYADMVLEEEEQTNE